MITMETIRKDLQNIRYYYSRKEMFEKAFDCTGKNTILTTVDKYNSIICLADPRLYELYVCLYIKGNTQESAAEELCYSLDYVVKNKKRLFDFFYEKLNKVA